MGFFRTNFPAPGRAASDDLRQPVEVSRTLVKSEPELADLISSEPRLSGDGVEVSMAEKGFGTRVTITAGHGAALPETELEAILDELAEPQKRPFSGT